jgi:hypothetical protein
MPSDTHVASPRLPIDKDTHGLTFWQCSSRCVMEAPTSTSSKHSSASQWILGVVGAAILYLLSGPPLFILAMRGYLPPQGVEFVRQFTRPFVWARDDSPLSNVLRAYSTWWWSIAGPP